MFDFEQMNPIIAHFFQDGEKWVVYKAMDIKFLLSLA